MKLFRFAEILSSKGNDNKKVHIVFEDGEIKILTAKSVMKFLDSKSLVVKDWMMDSDLTGEFYFVVWVGLGDENE